jgi:nucleotide-binding universal stress UspA family protein
MDQTGVVIGPIIISVVLYLRGNYSQGFAILLMPSILALCVLGLSRRLYPNPHNFEKTSVIKNAVSWYVSLVTSHQNQTCCHNLLPVSQALYLTDVYLLSVVKMSKLVAEEGDISMSEINRKENEYSSHHKLLIDKYFTGSILLVESRILHGDPAAEIVEFANSVSADLIVIGNTGKSGLKRVFLGGTSETVSHNASCSVLIVKKGKIR